MKKILTLVVMLLAGWGGYYILFASGRATGRPEIVQAALTAGDVVQQVQATGLLEPLRTVPVGSQVSGVVTALYADFNSIVRKGQVLAELDPSLLQTQVDLQAAAYERQLSEIANQEALLQDATTQLERTQVLAERALATQQQLDQALVTVAMRTNALESARKQLLTARANLDQAKLNLSYAVIRSPLDGVVISRDVDIGQTVQSRQNVAQFFTIASDLRQLRLTASIDEAEIAQIRPGMAVTFTVDAYPRDRFRGVVNSVQLNAVTNSNVVTYPVLIDTENPELKLRPGMTASIRIPVATARNVVRIPTQALRFRPTADTYAALGLTPPTSAPARIASTTSPAADRTATAAERAGRPSAGGPDSGKIDDHFQTAPSKVSTGRVWIWSEADKTFREVPVVTAASDGTYSELVEGDLAAGQPVVTGVVLPQTNAPRPGAGSAIFDGRPAGGPPPGFFPRGG